MDRFYPEHLKPVRLVATGIGRQDYLIFGNWDKGTRYLWLGFDHNGVTQVDVTAWKHILSLEAFPVPEII